MIAICRKIGFGFLLGSIFLFGCAETPLKVQPIAKTEHPAALATQLGEALAVAKKNRVDVLSPTWYGKASESYSKAQSGLDKGTELSAILNNIATGSAQLQQAQKNAEKSRYHLSKEIESREDALKVGAQQFGKDFAKLDSAFLKLTEAVENNDIKYVNRKKKEVNNQYRAFELRAIKHAALGDIRRLIQSARDQEIDEIAPKSFIIAQSKLADADAFISQNRYAKQAIADKAQDAGFYAQRMQEMARTSVKLEEMQPEDIALWVENLLSQTSAYLKDTDRRNLPFDAQQKSILKAITALKQNRASISSQVDVKNIEIEKLNARIANLEGRTYKQRADKERLAADKERLAAEKRFEALYTKVQGFFSSDQAEVYKKAHQLVIRLKAIRFPVGQAVIVPSNYPLLTTVQKAIRTFGQPDVVIEGHTDSTGSEAMNQRLSQSRAESVQQYMIANATLPAKKIAAAGYGSSRPLASNATAEGRAINRRIDVIIKPQIK